MNLFDVILARKIEAKHGGGITPTGEIEITDNGTYDVTEYASADVNVSGGGGGGDFSTFTMTLVASDMLSMTLPQIFEAGEMGEGAPAALVSVDSSWEAGEYKIAAYKGASAFTVNGGANKHIAVSGDVTYFEEQGANGTLQFTGDGTVTYS